MARGLRQAEGRGEDVRALRRAAAPPCDPTDRNRYQINACPTTLDDFYDLRDRIFLERKAALLRSHESERAYYESKPWLRN